MTCVSAIGDCFSFYLFFFCGRISCCLSSDQFLPDLQRKSPGWTPALDDKGLWHLLVETGKKRKRVGLPSIHLSFFPCVNQALNIYWTYIHSIYLQHDHTDLFDTLDDGFWCPRDCHRTLGGVGQHVPGYLHLGSCGLEQTGQGTSDLSAVRQEC